MYVCNLYIFNEYIYLWKFVCEIWENKCLVFDWVFFYVKLCIDEIVFLVYVNYVFKGICGCDNNINIVFFYR